MNAFERRTTLKISRDLVTVVEEVTQAQGLQVYLVCSCGDRVDLDAAVKMSAGWSVCPACGVMMPDVKVDDSGVVEIINPLAHRVRCHGCNHSYDGVDGDWCPVCGVGANDLPTYYCTGCPTAFRSASDPKACPNCWSVMRKKSAPEAAVV